MEGSFDAFFINMMVSLWATSSATGKAHKTAVSLIAFLEKSVIKWINIKCIIRYVLTIAWNFISFLQNEKRSLLS